MALEWEARGAPLEWGGVYAQGIRLTGPWRTRFEIDGRSYSAPETLTDLHARRWEVESAHRLGDLTAHQRLAALPEAPGVGRHWEIGNPTPSDRVVGIVSEWSPYLSPVIVEAYKPYQYRAERTGATPRFASGGHAVLFESEPASHEWYLNDQRWDGSAVEGEVIAVRHETRLDIPAGGRAEVDWLLWGGLERFIPASATTGREALAARADWRSEAIRPWQTWFGSVPRLSVPAAPRLEAAFQLAEGALRALYTRPQPDLTALVAGYPWYSTIWCRDLAWSLPAVLWMGDFEWARQSIESVVRFQAPEPILLLSAEKGELPMELSAGPAFIFGTSDTTHHYPDLIRRLVEHSADLGAARALYPAVERAIGWGRARVDPTSHLVRNGGELERMMALAKLTGRFEFGIDVHDATIWDSVDRRDYAIDVQVLWHYALIAYRRLSALLGFPENVRLATAEDTELGDSVATRYSWPEEQYLVDSVRRDGGVSRKLRPNALRTVAAGLVPPAVARNLVERACREDLLAPWGVRTLSRNDPGFVPTAYHDGQVWSIATAWAAEAAFAVGDAERGTQLLGILAEHLLAENGLANECYRGDRPVPFNSCYLLGFSIGPFLTNVFEGLWGLQPAAPDGVLRVAPRFPPAWPGARLSGLRFGGGVLDLEYEPGSLQVRHHGPRAVRVVAPGAEVEVAPDATARLDLPISPKTS